MNRAVMTSPYIYEKFEDEKIKYIKTYENYNMISFLWKSNF